jgi:pyruvate kinase
MLEAPPMSTRATALPAVAHSQEPPAGADGLPTPAKLVQALESLRDEMRARHVASMGAFGRVHPHHRRSAQNLVDYLTLRSHDIRPLQASLAELGVSSLGRAEEHVMRSLEQVIEVLRVLSGERDGRRTESAVAFGEGRRTLQQNASRLIGPSPRGRSTRIMVTMSPEVATDPRSTRRLVEAGMSCARINCAHDGPDDWERMVDVLRKVSSETGRPCPILMDLPGPKLRTGPIADGPHVVRLRPRRDARGIASSPARAVLTCADIHEGGGADDGLRGPAIPVDARWLERLRPGDRLHMRDTRGSARAFEVAEVSRQSASVEVWDTTYVETGLALTGPQGTTRVGALPPLDQSLRLRRGDVVTLTSDLSPATPRPGATTGSSAAYRIGCTLPAAFRAARVGHRVWFDDGKVGGRVRAVRRGEIDVEVTVAPPSGVNLKAARGINLPDGAADLAALSSKDDATVRFIAEHADLAGLSFAQRTSDIVGLQRRFEQLGRPELGILLKIETRRGFQHLPELLLAGMASERVGVMVARGDLAIECGFERLSEVQDEILWLCDAAHVPVVWATQVLDQMSRTGQPSRPEVSDAVMGARAECVMLNKGPFVVDAVCALDDILRRAETHQHKKVPLLRRLKSWSPE